MARQPSPPSVGSRVTFDSVDEALYPELAEKYALWDEPPQRRGGVVVAVNESISGSPHYVIVLDEPLNTDLGQIRDRLVEKYVSTSIAAPKRHVVLVQAIMVGTAVSLTEQINRRKISVAALKDYPNRMYRCHICKVAQRGCNLLMTCEEHSHMLCKKDLIPWDEENNRPKLSKCSKFTEQMKAYCHSNMGYEPTYIPTRVLLGYRYWCDEDKLKAVQDFLEYDLWVCFVCRFGEKSPRTVKLPNCTVKFGFIHNQLFPQGAEEEAGRIMTATDRDELSQFGRVDSSGHNDDNDITSDDRFLRLHDDLVLYVLDPASRNAHRVSCYKNWSLGSISREILKVSQISYNADIVIYKLDAEGWEVELCDLRLVDLDESSNASRDSDMVSIRDLCDNDVVVIRMRSLHKIGARSKLPGLGISDPSLGKEIGKIADIYSGFRRICGDGNCYYRAIAYGALEQVVLSGDVAKFSILHSIFARVTYQSMGDKDSHEELLNTVQLAADGTVWKEVDDLQSTFLAFNSNFDFALVSACRRLVSMYLIENQDSVTDGGLSLKDTFIEDDEGIDMAAYCDKYINEMGRDAEGPYIELGILPTLLRCRCVIFSLDMRHNSEKEYVCPFEAEGSSEALAVLHILLRPGHYDLLYTSSTGFPDPKIFQEVRNHEDAIQSQRAEEKVAVGSNGSSGSGMSSKQVEDDSGDEKGYAHVRPRALSIMDSHKDGPESRSPFASADRKDASTRRIASMKSQRSSSRLSDTARAKAVSKVQEVVPDITYEQAIALLENNDFNVEVSIDAFLTRDEVHDVKQDDMILDGSKVEKRRIYNRLTSEMPGVDSELIEDAVYIGECRTEDEVQKYIEKTTRKENSDRGGGERWSFSGFLGGRGRK